MAEKKTKDDVVLPREEVAAYLRRVADGFKAGCLELSGGRVATDGFKSLEISVKDRGAACKVKVSVKFHEAAAPAAVEGAKPGRGSETTESYKKLKKRMSRTFKAMRESLERSVLPDPSLVESFVTDSRAMVACPDKGAPQYGEYTKAVAALERAHGNADLEAVRAALEKLHQRRRACHVRYK
jgi:XXXCH domain-containing protein